MLKKLCLPLLFGSLAASELSGASRREKLFTAPKLWAVLTNAAFCDGSKVSDPSPTTEMSSETQKFVAFPIVPDGNCLFRAVAAGLIFQQHSRYSAFSQRSLATKLRNDCMDYLVENHDEFGWAIESSEDDLSSAKDDNKLRVQSYANHMKRNGVWGGELELALLSRVTETVINVYTTRDSDIALLSTYEPSMNKTVQKTDETEGSNIRPKEHINLLFYQYGHYDLLLPENFLPRLKSNL